MPDRSDKRGKAAGSASDVAAAMNRVLTAEREAFEALEECRLQAETTLESARHQARSILERAEQVAREIHGRTGTLAAARAQHLVESAAARSADPGGDLLEHALARLARRMTGDADA